MSGGAVRCRTHHTFDVARQGYVNLLPGDAQAGTGDTSAMVEARAAFLATGHYAAIGRAVADESERAVAGQPGGCIVELGAGTGYYLAQVLDRLPGRPGLAIDVSKYACRRAARAHPRLGAVVCDAWRPLPVRDGAAAAVLSVFAPRDGAEIHRILRPGGSLLVVTPTRRHLAELVATLGLLTVEEHKRERLDEKLRPFLALARRLTHHVPMSLEHTDVETVVGMGPSARHTDRAALREQIAALPQPLAVTASVTVSVYRRLTRP